MAFLQEEELKKMGFKSLGKNVLISDKCSIYRPYEMEFGDNVRIDDFCLLSGKIKFGRNIHLAAFSNVSAGECEVVFDDFSGLAYGCHVFTGTDDYTGRTMTNPTVPLEFKGLKEKNVLIGKHVIIGTNSVVFPGVTVSEGCAVAAMSVVTKTTEPWTIYFGNPAKKLKRRLNKLLELEEKYISNE